MADSATIERIHEMLRQGDGPDKIVRAITGRIHDPLHTIVVEEKTKLAGTYMAVPATPAAVAAARDTSSPKPRWKELAAMVYGDAGTSAVEKVRALYERQNGPGSASKSWTGRGAKPSAYAEPTSG
jgi:hypothetical protein